VKADTSRSSFVATKHFRTLLRQQGRVDLDAEWNEQQDIVDHLRTATTADLVGPAGAPAAGGAFAVTVNGTDLRLSPGRYYLDGVLLECDGPTEGVSVWDQPDLPDGAPIIRLGDGSTVAGPTPPAGRSLLYLDAWDLHRTALEDPDVREVALGGPDTTTRVKTVWQARLLRLGDVGANVNCTTDPPAWTALTAAPTGKLAARAEPASTDEGPCTVPAGAGYRGLENQHYRVEIRTAGPVGTATFLWARDNASTVASWVAGPDAAGAITVASPGRDSVAGFTPGMWVELTDDTRELLGTPGPLVQLVSVTGDRLTIDPATGIDLADFPDNPRVRRWDADGEQTVAVPTENGGWLPLEQGVEVRFDPGTSYHTGDFWTIPARTNLADILWPATGSTAAAVPRHGVQHHFAKLALVSFDGSNWTDPHDCRALFPPLTGVVELRAISGDGQTATPGGPGSPVPLAKPLVVGVANGSQPVPGARVRFTVSTGTGTVNPGTPVLTDAAGRAQASWQLDPATPVQQVTVELLDDGGTPFGLPVGFTASLLTAVRTAYAPAAGCVTLAGTTTVQQALDVLCQQPGGGTPAEPGMHVEQLVLLAAGSGLENDGAVPIPDLGSGIEIQLDASPDPVTVHQVTVYVTLELPFPTNFADVELWGTGGVNAYQPLVLASDIGVAENLIQWVPTSNAMDFLQRIFPVLHNHEFGVERLLCRLTMKGHHIWSIDHELYLDGDAFVTDGNKLIYPSGDSRKGGDFDFWFWLVEG
jgi:hypothetical protein